jgi:hypothetical protein
MRVFNIDIKGGKGKVLWAFFFFYGLFFPLIIKAQRYYPQEKFAFELWHEGKVVLDGGDTLKGKIQYNMQTELVQLQQAAQLETLTPRKVVFFEIFDQTVNRYRQFFSLPYALTGQYRAPVFFELLAEGKLTILSREKLEYKTYSSFYTYGTYTRLVLVNLYYLLNENGTIQEVNGKRNNFYDLMGNKKEAVEQYVKAHKLDFANKYNLISIIEYYNSLFK